MKAIILAAGIGSRLGRSLPKCLCELPSGETILARQTRLLRQYVDDVLIVVGFKKEIIMEMQPDLTFVYNPVFNKTNTASSLLLAMNKIQDEDVIWVNGDVVFKEEALAKVVGQAGSCVAVEYGKCGEEEIKFTEDSDGYIDQINKQVDGKGEAVGINKVAAADLETLKKALTECGEKDYFERGLELSYPLGIRFKPVDIGSNTCVEVDFIEDLGRAWELV
ncbi:MAG: NTP transferase domain-containing protein [Candidatus Saccharibacteria bacterium]